MWSAPHKALALFLALSTLYMTIHGGALLRRYFDNPADFGVFYEAAKVAASADRDKLYFHTVRGLNRPADLPPSGDFFNPPGMAYILWPLTLTPVLRAKFALLSLNVLAVLTVVLLSERWSRRSADVVLAGMAAASFWPLYTALHLGQASGVFALISALSFVALDKKRWTLAGWVGSFLVLKPSIAPLPLAVVALHGRRSTWLCMLMGVLLLGLAPFALVGGNAFRDFLDLLSASRKDAFDLVGSVTAGASLMFNWNGFVGRLAARSPNVALVLTLDAITLALMLKVWLKRDMLESWLAAALATCLAVPHMLYYDLMLLLAPSFAVAMRRRDPVLVGALAVTHLCINVSMWQVYHGGFTIGTRSGYMFIAASPAMLLVLVLLAFDGLPERIARALRLGRAPAAPDAAAETEVAA